MKITIKGHDIDLHYSMRIYIIYEQLTNQSLIGLDGSYTTLINLMYSAILATLQHDKQTLDVEYDDFIDWLDSQDSSKVLSDFANWFAKVINVNAGISEETKPVKGAKKPSKN